MRVDLLIVLYDANAIVKNDVQGALGAEESCQNGLAPRGGMGMLDLRSAFWHGIGIEGRLLIITGEEYVIDIELGGC